MKMTKLLIVLLFAVLTRPALADEYEQSTRAKTGDTAPVFACRTLSGEEFSLGKEKGKVVLINFFATWCGPCLAELPHLQKEIFEKFKDRKDFRLIVIGREHDAAELVKFAKEKGLSVPMVPDLKREIYGKYAEQYIPRNFVIGRDGKIKLASTGFTESDFAKVVETIEKELKRKGD